MAVQIEQPEVIPSPTRFRLRIPKTAWVAFVTLVLAGVVGQIAYTLSVRSEWDFMQHYSNNGEYVENLAYSPDRRLIATSDFGGVRLWNAADKRLLDSLGDEGPPPNLLAFSPSGHLLAWSHGSYVFFYDLEFGHMVFAPIKSNDSVFSIAFASYGDSYGDSGDWIAVGGPDSGVKIWNALRAEDNYSVTLAETGTASNIVFSPDGKMLGAVIDGKVSVWNIGLSAKSELDLPENLQKQVSKRFTLQTEHMDGYIQGYRIAFSPSRDRLATSDTEGKVTIWDTKDGHQVASFDGGTAEYVGGLAFSPDGNLIAQGSGDTATDFSEVRVWRISDGVKVAEATVSARRMAGLSFSPDGKQVLADFTDGQTSAFSVP